MGGGCQKGSNQRSTLRAPPFFPRLFSTAVQAKNGGGTREKKGQHLRVFLVPLAPCSFVDTTALLRPPGQRACVRARRALPIEAVRPFIKIPIGRRIRAAKVPGRRRLFSRRSSSSKFPSPSRAVSSCCDQWRRRRPGRSKSAWKAGRPDMSSSGLARNGSRRPCSGEIYSLTS